MKVILSFIFFFISINAWAQQGLVCGGGNAAGAGGSVNYSIGQIDYITASGIGGTISEGIQQPFEILVVTGIEEKAINLNYSLYPNPTTDFVSLRIENQDIQNMSYLLFSLDGKLILEQNINENITIISMPDLYRYMGAYFVKVVKNGKIVKVFKVLKIE